MNRKKVSPKYLFGFFCLSIFVIFAFASFSSRTKAATAPSIITYQGKLLVNSLAATTTQNMYFALYDSLTNGAILYTASGTLGATTSLAVTPSNGIFNVDLGGTGTNSLDSAIFQNNAEVYLEVRIGNETLSPRKRITSAPYALNARYLEGIVPSSNTTTIAYIPVSDSSGNFNFNQVTSTRLIVSGSTTLATTTISDYLGVGTSTPAEKLHLFNGTLLVDNPTNPSLVGSIDTTAAYSVYVSGKYAYVADGTAGLRIIDMATTTPRVVGTISTTDARDVRVSGKYAYVADNTIGLRIIDVSNPASPSLVATQATTNAARVYVVGKYAYVGDTSWDFSVIDVSNPTTPTLIATLPTVGDIWGINVSGRYAYVAAGQFGFKIIDISNPSTPTLVSTLATTYALGVQISGKYAYVADGVSGLRIIDISDPLAPRSIATIDTTYANSVYLSGRQAYVTDYTDGLKIIDIKGAEIHAANIGNISTNDITALENVDVGNNLNVGSGLNVGFGGILNNGSFGSLGTSTFIGSVGIGTTTPESKLHILGSAEQLRLAYDGTNYTSFTVASDGSVTIMPTNSATTTISGTLSVLGSSFFSTIASGTWNGSTVAAQYGGTSQDSSGWSGFVKVTAGTWSTSSISLASDVSGVLALASGGTNTSTSFTGGSIIFSNGTSLAENNSNLFWDNTNNRLGIGNTTPSASLDVAGRSADFNSSQDGSLGSFVTNANALPSERYVHSSIVANGYVYVLGGDTTGPTTSSINYAKLNADGSTGAWVTNNNSLPSPRKAFSTAVVNGYIYVIGGTIMGVGDQSTVFYAKLNADGSTGAWATSTNSLPATRSNHTSAVANGYVYVIGGNVGGGESSDVSYARLNADGSMGPWTTNANALPSANANHSSVVANGYVYVIGGTNGTVTWYAKLNSDGTISSWQTALSALPEARYYHSSVVANGYVYVIGGWLGSFKSTVYFAKLNFNGTIGSWQTNSNVLPGIRGYLSSVVANGYVYAIGGGDGLTIYSTVYYSSTARIRMGGALDLLGLVSTTLADSSGNVGSSLYAGSLYAANTLEVSGNTQLWNGLSVAGNMTALNDFVVAGSTTTVLGKMMVGTSTLPTTGYQLYIDSGSSANPGLGVNGYVKASGYITGTTTLDLAETYPINPSCQNNNTCPERGDAVCLVDNLSATIEKCSVANSSKAIGIISSNPGFTLGDSSDRSTRQVALAGRVPLKISIQNGTIKVGDRLTTSEIPGVAIKASEDGPTIGIALENYDGAGNISGFVLTFVNIGGRASNSLNTLSTADHGQLTIAEQSGQLLYKDGNLNLAGNSILQVASIVGANNAWYIDKDGYFVTRLTTSQGTKDMYALQSPLPEFVFSSSSQLITGEVRITFDTVTQEIIDQSQPLKVVVSLTSPSAKGIYATEKTAQGFLVKELDGGTSNATFDWVVVAKRASQVNQVSDIVAPTESTAPAPTPTNPATPTEPANNTSTPSTTTGSSAPSTETASPDQVTTNNETPPATPAPEPSVPVTESIVIAAPTSQNNVVVAESPEASTPPSENPPAVETIPPPATPEPVAPPATPAPETASP